MAVMAKPCSIWRTILLFDRRGTLVYGRPKSILGQRNWLAMDPLLAQALAAVMGHRGMALEFALPLSFDVFDENVIL